jgi:hypothetical protein
MATERSAGYLYCAAGCGPLCWRLSTAPEPGAVAAKRVRDADSKMATLRNLVAPCQNNNGIGGCGGYCISAEQVGHLFDLMEEVPLKRRLGLAHYFADRQRLRHTVAVGSKSYTWTGVYRRDLKAIVAYGKRYVTLDSFAAAHWALVSPDAYAGKGWNECTYEYDGFWWPMSGL